MAVFNKQKQVQEILKCGKDPKYFLNRYAKIISLEKGLIPFKTFPFQDDVIDDLVEHRLNVVVKARQLGLSTITAGFAVWMALFHKHKNILVIATKLPTAINFIKKVKTIIKNLPPWLMLARVSSDQKQAIEFSHGSTIKAIPTSDDAGRSEALSLLIIDEAAHIKNFDDLWTGLYPTISTGGRCVILSTPNGVGGQYHKLYTDAAAGLNNFNPINLPWDVHPEHDEEWFKDETRGFSARKIAQEYLCVSHDTRIITDGGFKLAKDISVGDNVLTHKGRFKKVIKTASRLAELEQENVYNVSAPYNRTAKITFTGNHPLLVNREGGYKNLKALQDSPTINNEWVPLDDLAADPKKVVHCLYPKLSSDLVTNDITSIDLAGCDIGREVLLVGDTHVRYPNMWGCGTLRNVSVDYDLGRFVGLFMAEGSFGRHGSNKGIRFGFHSDEWTTYASFCKDFLSKHGVRTRSWVRDYSNACIVETHNAFMQGLMRFYIKGEYSYDKVLRLDRVLASGHEFIKGYLTGHFEGDATHREKVVQKLTLGSTSLELLYQVRTLLSLYDIFPRIGKGSGRTCILEIDGVDGKFVDDLFDHPRKERIKRSTRARLVSNMLMGRCQYTRLNDTPLLGGQNKIQVYDIQVEDDSSFVADSIVAHNCDFVASGETFLGMEDIEWVRASLKDPIDKIGDDRSVWVWEHPKMEHQYIIPADVARGDSADYSAFHVIDMHEGEVVAEYKGRLPPDEFGVLLDSVGRKYNTALLVPESNSFGYATLVKLKDLDYPRVYKRGSKAVYIVDYSPIGNDIGQMGFDTNGKTRIRILTKLEEVLRQKALKVYSSRLYDELKTFVWTGTKAQAMKGRNDDLVMSLAIGLWLYDVSEGYSTRDKTLSENMIAAMGVSSHDISEVPGSGRGMTNEYHPFMPRFGTMGAIHVPEGHERVGKDPRFNHGDFDWVLGGTTRKKMNR